MRSLSRTALPVLAVLAGCGDDGPTPAQPDAPMIDAAIDAPMVMGCDYSEQRDGTNDDVPPATGTPEQTGVTFATRTVICGTFDHTHFDGDITVDIDGYVLNLAADADVLVRIDGAGAQNIELVGVDIYTGANLSTLVGNNTFYGDHGVTAVHLTAGTYELAAFALNGTAITTSVPYRLEIVMDTPDTRCPELTSGGFPEAMDGATNDGNDMIRIASGMPPALTMAADAPEATGITVVPATSYRITGSSADIATPDLYEDKDTFAFTTGATANELAVRLTWPGTTANLDYLLFEAGSADPVTRAQTTANQAPELKTFSVKPSTSYWLLVGTKAGSSGFPVAYTATLCGARFAPP